MFQLRSIPMMVLLTLTGCSASLHPLYENARQLKSPEPYVGCWESERYLVGIDYGVVDAGEQALKNLAVVTLLEDPRAGRITPGAAVPPRTIGLLGGGIVELDGTTYLDLTVRLPLVAAGEVAPTAIMHALPVHTISKIELIEGQMLVTAMDPEKVGKFLQEHPAAVPHTEYRPLRAESWNQFYPRQLLTGSPAELQAFLKRHGKADIWRDKPLEFTRMKASVFEAHYEKLLQRM